MQQTQSTIKRRRSKCWVWGEESTVWEPGWFGKVPTLPALGGLTEQQLEDQLQIPALCKDKLNRQRPEGRWRSASSEGRSMYFSLGDIIVRLIYSPDYLGKSSYPMPVTRVRKLMDELVSS